MHQYGRSYEFNRGKGDRPLRSFLWATSLMAILAGCTNQPQTTDLPSPTGSPSPDGSAPLVTPSPSASLPAPLSPSPTALPSALPASPDKPAAVRTVEDKLTGLVSQATGLTLRSIDCPATLEEKAGTTYDCQATSEAGSFTVVVQPTGQPGQFGWRTRGLLLLSKLNEFLQKTAPNSATGAVTVDCGGKARVAKTGDVFECKLTTAKGKTQTARVTVRDDAGNVLIAFL